MGKAKAVFDRFWTHVRNGEFNEIPPLLHPAFQLQLSGMSEPLGATAAIDVAHAWRTAFRDFGTFSTITSFSSADGLNFAATLLDNLTHTGPFPLPPDSGGGSLPPTGNEVSILSNHILTVEPNGLMRLWTICFDTFTLFTQLGITGR